MLNDDKFNRVLERYRLNFNDLKRIKIEHIFHNQYGAHSQQVLLHLLILQSIYDILECLVKAYNLQAILIILDINPCNSSPFIFYLPVNFENKQF